MKKFLIFLSIVLLIGTGYFTYDKWVKDANVTLWSFVPNNAVLVYESSTPLTTLKEIAATDVWKNLNYIQPVANIQNDLDILDTLAGKGNFSAFFEDTPTLISVDITSSTSIDFLFIVEIQNLSQQSFISKAQAYFEKQGFSKRTREYDGFTITELVGKTPNESFTYIFYKNYFIGSFSAFLVEDAIRTMSDSENLDFEARNPELKQLTKLAKDQGNVYVNAQRIGDLVNVTAANNTQIDLGKSGFLDLKISEDLINLTGFLFLEDETEYLHNFSRLDGASFDMSEIVPNNTAWIYHFGTSDPIKLGENLATHFQKNQPKVLAERQRIQKEYDLDVNHTFTLIDEEIGLLSLESTVTGNRNQLMILETNDMGEALRFFNSVGEREMQATGDSLYLEQYGDYEIRKLPAANFPYALIGSLAGDYKDCYYLQYRNYLIFSNHLQQLKNLTLSIEDEATWTKSIRINRFLEKGNQESNFSLYINTPRAWNQVLKELKPEWKSIFEEYQFSLKNLEFITTQFSAVDDKFYTNVNIYQPNLPKRNIPDRITALKTLTVADYITTKPYLLLNHNDRSYETFIQDTTNTIYLIDKNFNVLWDKQLDEQITSDVSQIDYYNNGKLQMIFTTAHQVHIIDRTGSYIPEFPKSLPENREIEYFNIIDYDNSKKYRFAIAGKNGNVYLTDKNLKVLEGWDPKAFQDPLVMAPQHLRVNGKDVIVIQETSGKLWVLTRRVTNYPGFPKNLEAEVTSPVFIKNANSFDEATVTVLTKTGELIEFNLNAQMTNRDQIYKPGLETQFELLEDVTGDSYVIVRKTDNKYEILNEQGEQLFQKDYFSKTPLITQYYQLGSGVEFIVMVDTGGTFLYVYDQSGNLISGRPLTASCPVSIMQYENEYQIYKAVDRNLELISISY